MEESEKLLQYSSANKIRSLKKLILKTACEKETVLAATLELLLKKASDYNREELFACVVDLGFYEKVEVFLKDQSVQVTTDLLCTTLRYSREKFVNKGCDHNKCADIILEKLETLDAQISYKIVNGKDYLENTPLYYSQLYGDEEKTWRLFKLGASLVEKGYFNTMPIEEIESNLLDELFDYCINFTTIKEENKNEKIYFEVKLNYNNFMPPEIYVKNSDVEAANSTCKFQLESEVVEYISRSPRFQSLLMHPLVVCFLLKKWHRIQYVFYINLLFHCYFLVTLWFYTLYSNSFWTIAFQIAFWLLIFREISQIVISHNNYLQNYVNLIEFTLIITCAIILYYNSSYQTKNVLLCLAIFLGAFEFLILLGKHPFLATFVVMFKTVTLSFFKLSLVYSVVIVAFSLCFHIIFTSKNNSNENKTDDFDNSDNSLFKTSVMLSGEFNSGDLNFEYYPVASKIIFSLFQFLVAVNLFNLINGLAVSDTQKIQNEAQLTVYSILAQHIFHVENVLLSPIFSSERKIIRKIKEHFFLFNKPENSSLFLYPYLLKTLSSNEKTELKIEKTAKKTFYKYYFNKIFVDDETINKILELYRKMRHSKKTDVLKN